MTPVHGVLVPGPELGRVPVDLPIGNHVAFLWVAVATHALVGATLGAVLFDRPLAGLVGGVVADLDLLFPAAWGAPFVHRGITHTALAAAAVATVASRWDRDTGVSAGTGYASHLAIDATTATGVPLLVPLTGVRFGPALGGHSGAVTAVVWVCCFAALFLWRR